MKQQNRQTPQKSRGSQGANNPGANVNRTPAPGATEKSTIPTPPKGPAAKGPQTSPRAGQAQIRTAQRKSGLNLRPLDIAMLFVGVVVVGMLIWFGLNANNASNPGTASTNPASAANTATSGTPAAGDTGRNRGPARA